MITHILRCVERLSWQIRLVVMVHLLMLLTARTVAQLSNAEINQINTAFGITLTNSEKTKLANIVKPTGITPQWRIDAENRIEQIRKADFSLEIVDANGNLIPNATVTLHLKKKDFRFGGIMDLKKFTDGASHSDSNVSSSTYKQHFQTLFDYAGLNNGLKPKLKNGNEANLPAYFTWLDSVGMTSRGHLLMWPGGTHMSNNITTIVEAIEAGDNSQAKKDELKAAITAEITDWASKWNVTEWDVINEVLSNHRIQDILGEAEMINWFTLAEDNAVNPNCRLMINDYQIISAKETLSPANHYINRRDAYKTQIQQLIDLKPANKRGLTGIGFQSRFGWEHVNPATLYNRLEDFAGYNLPLVGTEFEVKDRTSPTTFSPGEDLRSQITEEVMTIYFSHAKTEGLYAWEYLSSSQNTALLDGNGRPKLNGLVWYYLNRIRYQTDTSGTSDINAKINFRGFKGLYEIHVSIDGQDYNTSVTMNNDGIYQAAINYNGVVAKTYQTTAIEDAHVRESKPTKTAANWQELALKKAGNNGNNNQYAYLKFSISGLTGTPTNTRLRLSSSTIAGTIEAYIVNDNTWSENTLTWNNKPSIGNLIGSKTCQTGETFDIDLGNLVTQDQTITIALKTTNTTAGKIFSSEATDDRLRPKLIISIDSDNDGISDGWEITYSGNLSSMNNSSDKDSDGSSDKDEFEAGTDPTDPNDLLTILSITQVSPTQRQLTWSSKPGKQYKVLKSSTLAPGSWVEDTGFLIQSAGSTTSTNCSSSSQKMFYRIKVVNP